MIYDQRLGETVEAWVSIRLIDLVYSKGICAVMKIVGTNILLEFGSRKDLQHDRRRKRYLNFINLFNAIHREL